MAPLASRRPREASCSSAASAGNFYAIDASSGEKLWGQQMGGPIAGGVRTYTVNGGQKVAVTTGLVSPDWPVKIARAKIAILGVEGETGSK